MKTDNVKLSDTPRLLNDVENLALRTYCDGHMLATIHGIHDRMPGFHAKLNEATGMAPLLKRLGYSDVELEALYNDAVAKGERQAQEEGAQQAADDGVALVKLGADADGERLPTS